MRTIHKPPFWDSTSFTMGDFQSMGGFHAPVAMIQKKTGRMDGLSQLVWNKLRATHPLCGIWPGNAGITGMDERIPSGPKPWRQSSIRVKWEAVVVVPMIWWQVSRPTEIFTSKLLVPCQSWMAPASWEMRDLTPTRPRIRCFRKGPVYLLRIASE